MTRLRLQRALDRPRDLPRSKKASLTYLTYDWCGPGTGESQHRPGASESLRPDVLDGPSSSVKHLYGPERKHLRDRARRSPDEGVRDLGGWLLLVRRSRLL